MSLSSDINTTSTALSDIKTAIIAKGVTPTGNITTYAAAIGNINTVNNTTLSATPTTSAQNFTPSSPYTGYGSVSVAEVTAAIDANITAGNIKKDVTILGVTGDYEGSGGGGKYKILDRIVDDTNTDIGMVVGFHHSANNTEYAIVALNAVYRLTSGHYLSSNVPVTDLPNYATNNIYGATETATFNCDKILAQATTSGLTSTAVSHCRSRTFTIGGVSYAGQLPTLMELLKVLEYKAQVNANDPTAATSSSLVIGTSMMWSSSQVSSTHGWYVDTGGKATTITKSREYFVLPVLEIPNI